MPASTSVADCDRGSESDGASSRLLFRVEEKESAEEEAVTFSKVTRSLRTLSVVDIPTTNAACSVVPNDVTVYPVNETSACIAANIGGSGGGGEGGDESGSGGDAVTPARVYKLYVNPPGFVSATAPVTAQKLHVYLTSFKPVSGSTTYTLPAVPPLGAVSRTYLPSTRMGTE